MEMKNICGKIPVELHEKLKLEVEELGISIPKYLEMVIEEHMTRKGEKTDMANSRTVAVQVTEDLFSRLKAVLAKNGMKQKDFLIGLIEDLKQMKSRQSQKTKSQRKQNQQNWKPKKQKNLSQRKRNHKNRHHKTETKRRKRCREICTVFFAAKGG